MPRHRQQGQRQSFADFLDPAAFPEDYHPGSLSGLKGWAKSGANRGGGRAGFGASNNGHTGSATATGSGVGGNGGGGGGYVGGGRGRGGAGAGGKRRDYTNVQPVNYELINREGYRPLDVVGPSPYTSVAPPLSGAPSPRPSTPGQAGSSSAQQRNNRESPIPSGSATPHTGVGFQTLTEAASGRSRGGGRLNAILNDMEKQEFKRRSGFDLGNRGRGSGRSFGKGKGRDLSFLDPNSGGSGGLYGAPLFVKSGVVFDEPPPDIATPEVSASSHNLVNAEKGSDHHRHSRVKGAGLGFSAPQQVRRTSSRHHHDRESDDVEPLSHQSVEPDLATGLADNNDGTSAIDAEPDDLPAPIVLDEVSDQVVLSDGVAVVSHSESLVVQAPSIAPDAEQISITMASAMDQVAITEAGEASDPEMSNEIPNVEIAEETDTVDDAQLFFVDSQPEQEDSGQSQIIFDTVQSTVIIGDSRDSGDDSDDDDEEIVFVPRAQAALQPMAPSPPPAGESDGQHDPLNRPFIAVTEPPAKKNRKQKKREKREKRAQRSEKRKAKRMERIKKTEGIPRTGDSDIDWGSDGPPQAETVDEQEDEMLAEENEMIRDYVRNTMHGDLENDDTSEAAEDDYSLDALRAFAEGMGKPQVTLIDLEDARRAEEEDSDNLDDDDAWLDTSGSELDEDAVGLGIHSRTAERMEESDVSERLEIDDDDDDDDDSSSDEVHYVEQSASEIDSDDDIFDEMFSGKNKWAVSADDYAKLVDSKKSKVYDAIEKGDFGSDWPAGPAPKGKKANMRGVPQELQAQWERDRLKKAEKKRHREEARLEAETSLYPARKNGKKSKAEQRVSSKKGKWQADRIANMSAGDVADMFSEMDTESENDDFDADLVGTSKRRKGLLPVTDLHSLDNEIRMFIRDAGKTTMTLPAMDKMKRKKVHELAQCYSLKSQSKGKGKSRFPTLIKTKHSTVYIGAGGAAKVRRILARDGGDLVDGKLARKQAKKDLEASSRPVRHRDGDVVGHGASAIGEDNIGHRLLSRMGWTEGMRIGMSGGLEAPIVAFVKTSKAGLGAL